MLGRVENGKVLVFVNQLPDVLSEKVLVICCTQVTMHLKKMLNGEKLGKDTCRDANLTTSV